MEESAAPGEDPAARALRLAHAKAALVSARHPQALVLGADQVADCAGVVLDKPGSPARCRAQLRASSGREVRFHTAAVLLRADPPLAREHLDLTSVRFRRLTDAEVARYVELDSPLDCAGGFRCESLGVTLFDSVESRDPTALIGLPLIWVAAALRAAGCDSLSV